MWSSSEFHFLMSSFFRENKERNPNSENKQCVWLFDELNCSKQIFTHCCFFIVSIVDQWKPSVCFRYWTFRSSDENFENSWSKILVYFAHHHQQRSKMRFVWLFVYVLSPKISTFLGIIARLQITCQIISYLELRSKFLVESDIWTFSAENRKS